MGKKIYRVVVNDDAETGRSARSSRRIESMGSVAGGEPTVEPVSTQAGETSVSGQYRGRYADKLAEEFAELFDAAGIEAVPVSDTSGRSPMDGYYALADGRTAPLDRAGGNVVEFEGTMRRRGTMNSHWRSVTTNPAGTDNDFGNDLTALVGLPAPARKTRWYDDQSRATEPAEPVAAVGGEFEATDLYDARESSLGAPTLLYEIEYGAEGKADIRVWDDRGDPAKRDRDGVVRWQRVFRTGHDYSGRVVLSNGVVRLSFDEAGRTVSVEAWDQGWSAVALGGDGTWEPLDVDVTRIGTTSVEAQVIWRNTADGSDYHLDLALHRGYDGALWSVPRNEAPPTPQGLLDKLGPVAHGQGLDPQQESGLVRRSEVSK